MIGKDIRPIIYSYLTLQELHEYNIDHDTLIRIFKARDIVLVKLLVDVATSTENFVSYKLMTRDESKMIMAGLEEMFPKYKSNGCEFERRVVIDYICIEKDDFSIEIITDYSRIISFFESCKDGEYSSYLKLFDIINDFIDYDDIICSVVLLRFVDIHKYLLIPQKSVLEELSYDEDKEILIRCCFRSTAQTKILSIKDYNKCVTSIKNKDIEFLQNFVEGRAFECDPICSEFIKFVIDTDLINMKRFRCFFGETDIPNGCLDELINECSHQ